MRRPVPCDHRERVEAEVDAVVRIERQRRLDVERSEVPAAIEAQLEGEDDRLGHVSLVDAAVQEADPGVEERFGHEHAEAHAPPAIPRRA